jgi:hypothetical protein
MSVSSEKLIESIRKNKEFTRKCHGYDANHPETSLSDYAKWLTEMSRRLPEIKQGVKPAFIEAIHNNQELQEYLSLFAITPEKLPHYLTPHCTPQERNDLVWICQSWINEQQTLLLNVERENRIKGLLGHENRQQQKSEFRDLDKSVMHAYGINKSILSMKAAAIDLLGLRWKPGNTKLEDLLNELDNQIKKSDVKIAGLKAKKEEITRKNIPIDLGNLGQQLRHQAHIHTVSNHPVDGELAEAKSRKELLQGIKANLLWEANQIYGSTTEAEAAPKIQKDRLFAAQKTVDAHIKAVASGKKVLDKEMAMQRDEIRSGMSRLYAELMPLMDDINEHRIKIANNEKVINSAQPGDPFIKTLVHPVNEYLGIA